MLSGLFGLKVEEEAGIGGHLVQDLLDGVEVVAAFDELPSGELADAGDEEDDGFVGADVVGAFGVPAAGEEAGPDGLPEQVVGSRLAEPEISGEVFDEVGGGDGGACFSGGYFGAGVVVVVDVGGGGLIVSDGGVGCEAGEVPLALTDAYGLD